MSDTTPLTFCGAITLRRDFFAVKGGESEFDWILSELGIPAEQRADIEEVSLDIDGGHFYTEEAA